MQVKIRFNVNDNGRSSGFVKAVLQNLAKRTVEIAKVHRMIGDTTLLIGRCTGHYDGATKRTTVWQQAA
ncbi:hypothetical protein [Bartonella apis]|uniref:hypothetical protein n=1 Tax=Bartonella apis TaxID=1686310 RepID=UPI003BB59EF0